MNTGYNINYLNLLKLQTQQGIYQLCGNLVCLKFPNFIEHNFTLWADTHLFARVSYSVPFQAIRSCKRLFTAGTGKRLLTGMEYLVCLELRGSFKIFITVWTVKSLLFSVGLNVSPQMTRLWERLSTARAVWILWCCWRSWDLLNDLSHCEQ